MQHPIASCILLLAQNKLFNVHLKHLCTELGCEVSVLTLGRSLIMCFCWMIQGFFRVMQYKASTIFFFAPKEWQKK